MRVLNNIMKKYKCPSCKTSIEVEGDSIMVMCSCGCEMIEQILDNHIVEKGVKE